MKMPATEANKLFIGGLVPATTTESLKEFYSQWGDVTDCIVMRDAETQRSRGFGFVTYSESSSCDTALSNLPHNLDGKNVDAKRAVPLGSQGGGGGGGGVKKVYVHGIQDSDSEETLKSHFTQFGAVSDVQITVDKATQQRRGFGFITFEHASSVQSCLAQKQQECNGHTLEVNKARSEEQKARDMGQRDGRSRGTGRPGRGGYNQGYGGRGGYNQGYYGGGRGGYGGGGGGYQQGYGGYGGGGYQNGAAAGYGGQGGYGWGQQGQYGGGAQQGWGGGYQQGYGAAQGGYAQQGYGGGGYGY